MPILNDKQIKQKLSRLAYEIIEHNTEEKAIYLAGINNNGYRFAELLKQRIDKIEMSSFETILIRVRLNPAKPVAEDITIDITPSLLKNKTVVLVDDVANTGRTLFYAFKPFLSLLLRKMQVAVLIDRKHKSFPIKVDYVGLSLATTIKDNIEVNLSRKDQLRAEIS